MNDKYTYNLDFVPSNIKSYRIKKGLTLEDLAEIMGTNKHTIWSWESGRCLPSLNSYFWLCFFLDVPNFNLFV